MTQNQIDALFNPNRLVLLDVDPPVSDYQFNVKMAGEEGDGKKMKVQSVSGDLRNAQVVAEVLAPRRLRVPLDRLEISNLKEL